jgi:hypothetical protein
MPLKHRVVMIDECIAKIVALLNTVPELETQSCCCGHGEHPASILLRDGRHLVLFDATEDGPCDVRNLRVVRQTEGSDANK